MIEMTAPGQAPRPVAHAASAPTELAGSVSLRVIATLAEFDALQELWSRLHVACDSTAFQSFEWQRAWWRHFGEGHSRMRLHIVVAEEGGEVVAIAPFVITFARAFGVVGLRQLELLGKGVTDYLDLLIRPTCASRVCAALASHVNALGGFDVISFVDVPDASPIRNLLMPALEATGWTTESIEREQCPRTRLLESWPVTLASFEDSHRKRIAYLDRKLKKNFKVEMRRVESPGELDAALETFMAMHQRRWVGAGEPGAFAHPRAVEFHKEIAQAFQKRGWLSLSFLVLDGHLMSANYAFRVGEKLEFYLSGVGDFEAARKFAPGILLHAYNMERLIGEGARIYDFLRGTERYKYELGAVNVPNWSLLSFAPHARLARMRHRVHMWHRRLGASAKRALMRARRSGT